MHSNTLSVKQLRHFQPLDQLSEKDLILLVANAEIKSFSKGEQVLALGSNDKLEYFLLKGSLELEASDGRTKQIHSDSESAKNAIALLQPRKYNVKALIDAQLVCIEQAKVNALLKEIPQDRSVQFNVSDIHSGHETQDIINSFKADLDSNNIELPSFPDTALRIRTIIDDPNATVKDVAEALINDPAITVKLLKTCNSALYRTAEEITSTQQAVIRLGFNTTKQLVTIFAMKELFNTKNELLKFKMAELWNHSREVAAISYVLAKMTPGLDPELSLLAGLTQDIGVIPILNYIERYPQFMKVESKVDSICNELKKTIGGSLLEKWGLNKELVDVAENTENWSYTSDSDKATYVDIAIIAQLHSYIGKKDHPMPAFKNITAFKKVGEEGLTPEQSQEILHESKHQIEEIKALLSPAPIPVLT